MPLMSIQDIAAILKDDSWSGSPFSISLEAFRSVRNDLLHVCGVKARRLLSQTSKNIQRLPGSFNKAPLDQQTKCAAECLEVIPKLAYLVSLSVRLSAQNCDSELETAHSKHMFAGHYVVFIFCGTMLKALV